MAETTTKSRVWTIAAWLLASLFSLSCALTGLSASPTAELEATPSELEPTATATSEVRVEALIPATVQVLAMVEENDEWVPIWSGSGSIVSPQGLILTNHHIIDDSLYPYDRLGVALTDRSDQPPELKFLAEVVANDPALDLALIRIASDLEEVPVSVEMAYVQPGDSDLVEIGDRLRILGYPGIGGETITFTEGAVSGFTLERGVGGRAWIKTDATIAGGNSGGMGINEAGELIGVPTIVTSGSETGQTVDCRPLADTDRDGDIDDQDTCVPVGGFINALRPINLALPILEAAAQGRVYEGDSPPIPVGDVDAEGAKFSNLVFSDGVTDNDRPTQLWYALPGGSIKVCVFWDYQNMANGLIWSSYWFVNGELDEGGSIQGQSWGGGERGSWWVCDFNERGLASGVYEVVLEVESKVLATESVFVGGDRVAIDFTLINGSSTSICMVNLSPAKAQNWGQNKLGFGEQIREGEQRVFPLASGTYDLRLMDCDEGSLLEEFSLAIEGDLEFTYSP